MKNYCYVNVKFLCRNYFWIIESQPQACGEYFGANANYGQRWTESKTPRTGF